LSDARETRTCGLHRLIKERLPGGHPGWLRCSSLKYSGILGRPPSFATRRDGRELWRDLAV